MTRGKSLIAVGAATLIAGLVITFPARVAYHWFAPSELALNGISGSIWNGEAVEGAASGFYLGKVAWRFRPWSLFTLKAAISITAEPPAGFIETTVAVGPAGAIRFDGLAASIPLASVGPILVLPGIEGDVSLQFERLLLEDGYPAEAWGTLGVSGLVLRELSPTSLGDYRAVLQTTDDGISGSVEDVSGVLDVDGTVVLGQDRGYSIMGKVAAERGAPDSVVEQLRYLGSPDADGRHDFRLEGQL